MSGKQVLEMLKSKDMDSGRMLILSLASMLRTGKPGVLDHPEIRELLADRLIDALSSPSDEVSDKLCITRMPSTPKSKYASAKDEFAIWYWEFLDYGKKPARRDKTKWLMDRGLHDVSQSTEDKWVKYAKDTYEPYMAGIKKLLSVVIAVKTERTDCWVCRGREA